ncbi:unnamed protein product [Ixodes pacificus]
MPHYADIFSVRSGQIHAFLSRYCAQLALGTIFGRMELSISTRHPCILECGVGSTAERNQFPNEVKTEFFTKPTK